MSTVTSDYTGSKRCPWCGAGLMEVYDTHTRVTELQCSDCEWAGPKPTRKKMKSKSKSKAR